MDHVLDVQRWVGDWNNGLWREIARAGRRAAFWAVQRALTALHVGDLDELADFVRDWLDYRPTTPRVEATIEALLELDLAAHEPDHGMVLLAELRRAARLGATAARHEGTRPLGSRSARWEGPTGGRV